MGAPHTFDDFLALAAAQLAEQKLEECEQQKKKQEGKQSEEQEGRQAGIDVIGINGDNDSDNDNDNGDLERRTLSSLHLDVLGEHDTGTIVLFAYDANRKKTVELREPDRLSYAKLLQIAGAPVKQKVVRDGEDSSDNHDKYSLAEVKNAICYLAGQRRLHAQSLHGIGCWRSVTRAGRPTPGVVLVGAGEAAEWHDDTHTLTREVHPYVGGRLLNISSSEHWYDFELLSTHLSQCAQSTDFANGVIAELVEILRRWQWRTPADPAAVAGLILATWIQTLWTWRPQVAVVGKTKAGKSILFETLSSLFGRCAVRSSLSSAAGIRQSIESSAVAVFCDEFEASQERQKIYEMVRASSRGDVILRGTTSQRGVRFQTRHMFWVASIESGMTRAPDRNRFCEIELIRPAPADAGKLVVPDPAALHDLGQRLLAVAVFSACRAVDLANRLKTMKIDGVDDRLIESYSVPAAILSVAGGGDESKAQTILERLLGGVERCGEHSDEADLLQTILASTIRIEAEKVSMTVTELLNSSQPDHRAILERHGIAKSFERVGPRSNETWQGTIAEMVTQPKVLFLAPAIVQQRLLSDTQWRGQNIEQILARVPGAQKIRRRLAGMKYRGVGVPLSYIESELFGVGDQELDEIEENETMQRYRELENGDGSSDGSGWK